jgi:hypothetical protein
MIDSSSIRTTIHSLRDGFSAAAAAHVGCLALPAVAGIFGASVSGGLLMTTMFVAAPIIAVGATFGIDHWRGHKTTLKKAFTSAAVALVVSFGAHQIMGDGHHHAHYEQAEAWFEAQDEQAQKQLLILAQERGMSLFDLINEICITLPSYDTNTAYPNNLN